MTDAPDKANTPSKNWTTLRFLSPLVHHLSRWGVWSMALGFMAGVGGWAWLRGERTFKMRDRKEHLIKLDVRVDDQVEALAWGVAGLFCVVAGYLIFALRRRKRTDAWPAADEFVALNLKLLPLAFVPALSALAIGELENEFPLLTLTLCMAIAIGTGIWFYTSFAHSTFVGQRRWSQLESRRLPEILVAVLMTVYAAGASTLAIYEHWAFQTHSYDLGIYDNTFWNTANGDWLRCTFTRGDTHISAHFDPIIILLSPLYMINPRAETLLVLQSVWLSLGSIPLFLHARRVLCNPWLACLCVLMYLAAPALHGVNLFDFHSLALMTPFAMWMIYALDAGKFVSYWVALGLMLLVREDMPLVACVIAAYALLMGRPRMAVGTIVAAVAYLLLIKQITHLVLPDGKGKNSYYYYYGELIRDDKLGALGLILSAVSDPIAALAVLFKPDKLLYFLKVLLPVLGLPLLAGRKFLLYSYGFAFIGLASRKYVYTVHFQYSILLIPFLYMGLPDGLQRLMNSRFLRSLATRDHLQRSILAAACVATLAIGSKYGALMPNESFRGGWNPLVRKHDAKQARDYARFVEAAQTIPEDAAVCTLTTYAPHLSNRRTVRRFPACDKSDYILTPNRLNKKDKDRLKRYEKDKRWVRAHKDKHFTVLRKE